MRFHLAKWSVRPVRAVPAIHERLQDVLLNVVIGVDDRRHVLAKLREILNHLLAAVIADIMGSRFGAEQNVIANRLLNEAVSVMTADDRAG